MKREMKLLNEQGGDIMSVPILEQIVWIIPLHI